MKSVYFIEVLSAEYFVEMTDAQVKRMRSLVRRFGGTVTRLRPTEFSLLVEHLENS
jgi:hypothetical protein